MTIGAMGGVRLIGLGGDGPNRKIPECPLCWARGGGSHGGGCPNMDKPVNQWISLVPVGWVRPRHPRPAAAAPRE